MVWNVISTFDVSWHPNIVRCDLIRAEDGALVRNFTDTDGKVYEERRIYKSDTLVDPTFLVDFAVSVGEVSH